MLIVGYSDLDLWAVEVLLYYNQHMVIVYYTSAMVDVVIYDR